MNDKPDCKNMVRPGVCGDALHTICIFQTDTEPQEIYPRHSTERLVVGECWCTYPEKSHPFADKIEDLAWVMHIRSGLPGDDDV